MRPGLCPLSSNWWPLVSEAVSIPSLVSSRFLAPGHVWGHDPGWLQWGVGSLAPLLTELLKIIILPTIANTQQIVVVFHVLIHQKFKQSSIVFKYYVSFSQRFLLQAWTILLSNCCVLRCCTGTQCSLLLSVIGVHHSPLSCLEALRATY